MTNPTAPPLADVLSAYWRQLITGGIPPVVAEGLVRHASERLVESNPRLDWRDLVAAAPDPAPTAVQNPADDTTVRMAPVDLWSDMGPSTTRR